MSDSTPATPTVPVGLGTQVGLTTALAGFVGGFVSLFLDGDHTPETILSFSLATLTLITVLAGRFAQAYALLRDAPTAKQALVLQTTTTSAAPLAATAGADPEGAVTRPSAAASNTHALLSEDLAALDPGDPGDPDDDSFRGLGAPDDPYLLPEDFDPKHEQKDLHDIEDERPVPDDGEEF